jgi:hypothetical protein
MRQELAENRRKATGNEYFDFISRPRPKFVSSGIEGVAPIPEDMAQKAVDPKTGKPYTQEQLQNIMNQREAARRLQQATFRFNQLMNQQRKADAFNAKPIEERTDSRGGTQEAIGLNDKEKEELKQLQAMLQQRIMPTQTITDEQKKKAIKVLNPDRKIVTSPIKRYSHIQSEFYNSPEYDSWTKGSKIGTMDMYYSPYFGQQGSGSIGRALDRAYKAWAKRTGNEAIKAPPRKSPLEDTVKPPPVRRREPPPDPTPPRRKPPRRTVDPKPPRRTPIFRRPQPPTKTTTVAKIDSPTPQQNMITPAGYRRDLKTGKLIGYDPRPERYKRKGLGVLPNQKIKPNTTKGLGSMQGSV